ncbi:hypothetical protein B0T21DRAFT_379955 [Apiosordaria backusii]|uniref:Methyltransferase domain-containing protein n=1 Tax=Apiosordaria backusii TaxID=314023 RepID=A0AA40EYU3_9PEZI|nr:hypothetical protein B0T21DRAFT_379955 [Apiosordaria backusii]
MVIYIPWKNDEWDAQDYINNLSFVATLATKVTEWLDPQPDDHILDLGCGANGQGTVHGIDTSRSMVNAAWDLARRYCLVPGGTFVFEMGGQGNIAEARALMLSAVARKIKAAPDALLETWFFPDEAWIRDMLEVKVGGFKVERSEMEWRPTKIDGEGGLYGWVKLVGGQLFGLIKSEARREEAIQEVVKLLEIVCRRELENEGGEVGYVMNYVRLRVIARKL